MLLIGGGVTFDTHTAIFLNPAGLMPALSNSRLKIGCPFTFGVKSVRHAYSFDRSAGALKIELMTYAHFWMELGWIKKVGGYKYPPSSLPILHIQSLKCRSLEIY